VSIVRGHCTRKWSPPFSHSNGARSSPSSPHDAAAPPPPPTITLPPATNVQLCFTLTSLTTLKRLGWDSVEDLAPGSIEYQLLTSLLPVLLLNGLLVLLPFALQALSIYYEDVKTYSEVQSRVLSRYFTIQVNTIITR
jgi:hypothetical protein